MSDLNLGIASSIELSDIRKLDILLTQCETSSCENICNDCCARLGSLEDDDDTTTSDRAAKAAAASSEQCLPGESEAVMKNDETGPDEQATSGVINNVPILSYVTEASTPSLNDPHDANVDVSNELPLPLASTLVPLSCDSVKSTATECLKRNPMLSVTRNYCAKCGGIKLDGAIKNDFGKKRYFSLDKERTNRISGNLLGTGEDEERGGSDNVLSGCRKHCSFEDNCGKSGCEGKGGDSRVGLKSPPSKKSSHRSDNTSSKSNPISSKSSQNSLKDSRSRKSSLFHGASDRDGSFRSRFSTHPSSRRFSTKCTLSQNDEQDAETREILLSRKADSDLHSSLKIPEPVEAVCYQKLTYTILCSSRNS